MAVRTAAAPPGTAGAALMTERTVRIADIRIGARHRKDMGDLKRLADSIATEGLLQPIGSDASDDRFGAVTGLITRGFRISRHARPLSSGKQTPRRGSPNVCN